MVRIKERYLLVNIVYPDLPSGGDLPSFVHHHQPTTDALNPQALVKGLRAEVGVLFGDYGRGAVESNLSVKYLSQATSTFILRVSRSHYRLAWAALTAMNRVPVKNGKPCIFRVVHVSGTIRKAEEQAIRRAKRLIVAARDKPNDEASVLLAPRHNNNDIPDSSSDDDDE